MTNRSPRTTGKFLAVAAGTVAVVVLTVAASLTTPVRSHDLPLGSTLSGSVVDVDGQRVADASVSTVDSDGDTVFEASTGRSGRFEFPLVHSAFLRITAPGYSPRVIAAAPGYPITAVLTHRSADSVSIRMGGDVMFGRRFYQPDPYGRTHLAGAESVRRHAAVLRPLRPLLTDGDITAVNLETALLPPAQLRESFDAQDRAGLHPDKDFVLVSSTAAAQALADSGVDVVSLGNNHVYDALDKGMASTIAALDAAGIAHFGGGRTVDEAWRPAVVTAANGQRVAFIGCTTVSGSRYRVEYVATARQGGAALCERDRLAATVSATAKRVDDVVVMIHGGTEYQRTQEPDVQALTSAAITAGAGSVVNHHPHVLGATRMERGSFVAESMGNLVFDQNLWDTLPSSLVRVDMRAGRPENAWSDPVVSNGYVPRAAVGRVADAVTRITLPDAGSGSLRTHSPSPVVARTETENITLSAGAPTTLVGRWPSGARTPGVRVGRDLLLGSGSFDDSLVGDSARRPALWALGEHAALDTKAQCTAADGTSRSRSRGLVLDRGGLSTVSAVASPVSRIPAAAGSTMTIQFDVDSATAGATVDVSFYASLDGGSFAHRIITVPERSEHTRGCQRVTVDVTVPKRAVAIQPFVKLAPPRGSTSARYLVIDDLKLIEWLPADSGRAADTLLSTRNTTVSVARDSSPGGD